MFYKIWGHDLTDNIRRLWFMKSEVFKSEFKNCPIVYIPYDEGKLTIERQPSFKRLLEILEVDVDGLYPITQPTQFERIIFPDGAFLSPHYPLKGFTTEYREIIDRVRHFALKNRTPTSIKKIYLFHGRRGQIGEERLAEYFKSKGYEIIHPEKLSFDEQLNLWINCESLASLIGSCSHNSLFCRDNTEAIFIPRAANTFAYYQEIINQVHPLNVTYIDSSMSIFSKGIVYNSFCLIISEQLKRFFGDKWDGYAEEDFKTFLQYVKNSMSKGLVVNARATDYYASILLDFMEQLKLREDLIASYNMSPRWEKFPLLLIYQTHVHKRGWSSWEDEGQISNDIAQKLDIQAIKINYPGHKVYYSVYYSKEEGWSEEVSNGEQAGTTGKSKSILGIKIRLDEAGERESDILYRAHKFDGQWTPWAKNGEKLLSDGVKLNAIQIKLETDSDKAET